MPDIKTRDIAKGTIKTIDKSAVAAEHMTVSYTHLRAHETRHDLVCRLLLVKKKKKKEHKI